MPIYSAFAPSILGMQSQAQSLGTISQNLANATAGGYKRTETRFQTLLSQPVQQQSDLGGTRPIDVQMIDRQGTVLPTTRDLDLAIIGNGFFVVSTALTGGQTFYTRDGSFEMRLESPGTGSGASTTAPGYLVDKNGYYLMGWAPDAAGVFPTSGAVQALRVDADYFANTFSSSTLATLALNLPASAALTAPTRQVDTVTLTGAVGDVGDVYSVTVGGTTLSYTTTGAEATIDDVRDALITKINAATGLNVTASANGTGTIRISANTAGTSFTSSASVVDAGAVNTISDSTTTANVTAQAAHATAVANADSSTTTPAGFYSYSISVIDSAGTRQPVRLNFTRSGLNSWEVSATHSQTPVAQVNTVTLAGDVEPGDKYSITVGSNVYSYTRSGATTTINTARDALVSQINANSSSTVTAAAGGTGIITLTAKTAGDAFTSSATATNVTSVADNTANPANIVAAAAGVAQVDDVTLAGTIEAGDVYSITVNGTAYSYTVSGSEAGISAVRDALIALVNADAALPVTASINGAGVVRLTADAVNTPFTTAASATNIGGGVANTASTATTTANVKSTTTTTSTTLPFTATGESGTKSGSTVTPPSQISLSLTFKGGSTASFKLDFANTTQFDTGFVALSQNVDGFEKSKLRNLSWDQDGYLVGEFNNDNSRRLYKVPLANFISPNTLIMRSGMVFEESPTSGSAKIEDPATSGKASFAPGSIESSNVDIASEFTRMIQTQAVYNANALAFRTNDELTTTARDLARA